MASFEDSPWSSAIVTTGEDKTSSLLGGTDTAESYKSEPIRWLVLLVAVLVATSQSVVWITFSASPRETELLFCLNTTGSSSDGTLDLLLNWGPIAYLPVVPFVMVALNKGGNSVHRVLLLGGVLTSLGALVRLLPILLDDPCSDWAIPILHLGQFLTSFFVGGCMIFRSIDTLSSL